MSFNVTIFVCLLANFLFSYRVYEAAKLPMSSLTIGNAIEHDKNVCKITSDIRRSKYLQECNELKFPDKTSNVTKENSNQFLCLALYDSYVKICQYNNIKNTKIHDTPVWKNLAVFDNAVEEIYKNGDKNSWNLCLQMNNSFSPVYNETSVFVEKLKLTFNWTVGCVKLFTNDTQTIEPLFIALNIINQQFDDKSINDPEKKESVINQSSANDSNISKTNKLSETKSKGIDPPIQKTNSAGKDVEIKYTTGHNVSVHTSDLQSDGQKKNINDKQKHSTTTTTTTPITPNVTTNLKTNNNPSNKNPAKPVASIKLPTDKNDDITVSDITTTEKKEEIPIPNIKSTTLSEKTRDEDVNPLDYDPQMADNDQIVEPDDTNIEIPQDDPSRQQQKDIPQLDDDIIDQKDNSIIRLSSTHDEDDSHFFGYFTVIGLIGIGGCLVYHRKQKILAMIVEGRRSRGGRGRKRPSTASYRKLDCNLEEAVTSQCNSNVSHVIY